MPIDDEEKLVGMFGSDACNISSSQHGEFFGNSSRNVCAKLGNISHIPLVQSSSQKIPTLLATYSVGKGSLSGNERRGERTGIRGKRIDTLFLGGRESRPLEER